MKTESPSSASASTTTSSNSNLRSPSPHRNAYEAGIQALKQAKDSLNSAANGDGQESKPKPSSRGRRYGSNVHRIKNMFLQMGSPVPGEGEDLAKGSDRSVRLSLPRASSLNENVDHSALLKLGATVSERVSRFDPKVDGGQHRGSSGFSKLQETRKIFEQRHLQEKQAATNRILLKKERASGFQDGRLDVVVRFNGSTESLDNLDGGGAVEAVSPTVSQLSAVFEKADLRNNLHRPSTSPLPSRGVGSPSGRSGALSSRIIAKKTHVLPQSKQEQSGQPKDQEVSPRSSRAKVSTQNEDAVSAEGSRRGAQAAEADKAKLDSEVGKSNESVNSSGKDEAERELGLTGGQEDTGNQEAASRLVQAEVHASQENEEVAGKREGLETASSVGKDSSTTEVGEEGEKGLANKVEESLQGEDLCEESRKEDYSEADLVDISAYSGIGEDSGGSQLDEEEDEDEDDTYEPESSCTEIPGLPTEEEPPPSRKIRFSTGPIKVSTHWGLAGGLWVPLWPFDTNSVSNLCCTRDAEYHPSEVNLPSFCLYRIVSRICFATRLFLTCLLGKHHLGEAAGDSHCGMK